MPSTIPSRAPVAPRTTPPASTTRRAWSGVPPVADISASERDWRRAPTAKAGPARRTTSISAITTISTTTATVDWLLPLAESRISAGIAESGGGSSITARESTSPPSALRARTCSHETGPPPTSQVCMPIAAPAVRRGEVPTRTGRSRYDVDSPIPTTVKDPAPCTLIGPPSGKPWPASALLMTTSSGACGLRPLVTSKMPSASGSVRSSRVVSA